MAAATLLAIAGIAGCADSGTEVGNGPTERSPAAETSTPEPTTSSPSESPSPTVEKQIVSETQEIPFAEKTVEDSALAKGTQEVRTQGIPGVKTLTYEVTLTDGIEAARELLREEITKKPVTQVIAIGTKSEPKCDPNYSGACVPIASDVDCAGGSGNGPAYVEGPVTVVGVDVYDLDRDGDGLGCEAD